MKLTDACNGALRTQRSALIIAAGVGSRLRALAPCKPLVCVGGLPLIEIAVRQLARAGVAHVVVVTGYEAATIEAALPAIAARCSVEIEAHRVANWSLPNGYSVMAGAARIAGDFLLVMADHILSADILSGLVDRHRPDHGVTLAVDRRLASPLIDPDDATFVRMADDGGILTIGKHLPQPEAVDCGAFLATPQLASAIAAAISEGRAGSLSDGMQWLADRRLAGTMDIGERWWIDVDDPRALNLAERDFAQHLPHLLQAA